MEWMDEFKFKNWQLTLFWVVVSAAMLIAGFVAGWVWRDRPGALSDVSILSAMTAVGTVGATSAAVYFGLAGQREQMSVRSERLTSMLWLIDEAVQSFEWISRHLQHRSEQKLLKPIPLARRELSAFLASMDAIERIPFHEPHFAEGHRALIHVLSVLRSYTPLVENAMNQELDEGELSTFWGAAVLLRTELNDAMAKEPCASLKHAGRLYF